ncbi:MAG TPA: hypothetical protein VH475_18035 [Tepidisphaeraceae bacterium]|jgi:hypothetical protein
MKRFIWLTFNVAAVLSLALLAIYVVGTIYFIWSDPAWFTIRVSTPLKTIRPLVVYSVLPVAWLIVRSRRQCQQHVRGFEPINASEHSEQTNSPPSGISN